MTLFNKSELGKRLIELKDVLGLSARRIALIIGADPSYYTRAQNGGGLSNEYLESIIDNFSCNKYWLLFGDGDKGQVSLKNEIPKSHVTSNILKEPNEFESKKLGFCKSQTLSAGLVLKFVLDVPDTLFNNGHNADIVLADVLEAAILLYDKSKIILNVNDALFDTWGVQWKILDRWFRKINNDQLEITLFL